MRYIVDYDTRTQTLNVAWDTARLEIPNCPLDKVGETIQGLIHPFSRGDIVRLTNRHTNKALYAVKVGTFVDSKYFSGTEVLTGKTNDDYLITPEDPYFWEVFR